MTHILLFVIGQKLTVFQWKNVEYSKIDFEFYVLNKKQNTYLLIIKGEDNGKRT